MLSFLRDSVENKSLIATPHSVFRIISENPKRGEQRHQTGWNQGKWMHRENTKK